jgi:hypothetical protein
MALTLEQKNKIKATLAGHYPRSCNFCGSTNWELAPDLAYFPLLDVEYKMPIEGLSFPVVLVICGKCGNTLIFTANKFGIP